METKRMKRKVETVKTKRCTYIFDTVYLDELTQEAEDAVFDRLADMLIEQEMESEKNGKNSQLQVSN